MSRMRAASTLPQHDLDALLRFFRQGGRDNLRGLLRELARHAGYQFEAAEPKPLPRFAGYLPGTGAIDLDRLVSSMPPGKSVIPILFYRALLLADDTAAVDALCDALSSRGLAPAPLMVTSLKDTEVASFLATAFARLDPIVIVTMTAFAASGEIGEPTPLDAAGAPVLQVVAATTRRTAWRESARGLGAADLAMHIVLPELDGRVLAGVVAFKDPLPAQNELCFTALASRPESDRVAVVAERIAAMVRLRAKPRSERQVAVLMPDYPGAPGRTGYAVGLDVPASVVALLDDFAAAGYGIRDAPPTARELLALLAPGAADASLTLAQYQTLLAALPAAAVARLHDAWGEPETDPDVRRRRILLPRTKIRQRLGRAAARSRPLRRAARRLPRSGFAAAPCVGRFRVMAPARDESRCARPHGRARHIGMAAGKSGRAHRGMFPGNRRRDAAGDLSVHCQQSRRGGAGQAPHCRRHYRPPAATAGDGRTFRRCARARTPGRRICRKPTASTGGGASASRN